MKLSKNTILSFQKLYEKKYNKIISIEESEKKSIELLQYMNLFYKKIPKNNT